MLSLGRKWGRLDRYVSGIYETLLKLHLGTVCRRFAEEVLHDLIAQHTPLCVEKRFQIFCVAYVDTVNSVKRMRFDECTSSVESLNYSQLFGNDIHLGLVEPTVIW